MWIDEQSKPGHSNFKFQSKHLRSSRRLGGGMHGSGFNLSSFPLWPSTSIMLLRRERERGRKGGREGRRGRERE